MKAFLLKLGRQLDTRYFKPNFVIIHMWNRFFTAVRLCSLQFDESELSKIMDIVGNILNISVYHFRQLINGIRIPLAYNLDNAHPLLRDRRTAPRGPLSYGKKSLVTEKWRLCHFL